MKSERRQMKDRLPMLPPSSFVSCTERSAGVSASLFAPPGVFRSSQTGETVRTTDQRLPECGFDCEQPCILAEKGPQRQPCAWLSVVRVRQIPLAMGSGVGYKKN
jgi:hypothetical protein